jgi:type IV pilus assembly protein PilM
MTRTKDKIVLNQVSVALLGDQSPDNLISLLKPFLPVIAASPGHVRVVLSGSSLLVRCVQMPPMTQTELKSAIRFEAENHIAFPIDDCVLDFKILNQDPEKKVMNVLLVAAKRDFIQERLRMLFDLDIHPEVIDVDTFALVNAYEALNAQAPEKIFGLLNIGHRVTSLAIIKDGLPLFVRELPLGSYSVTKALSEARGISDEKADEIKVLAPPEAAEELKAAYQTLDTLTEELRSSIQYFENEAGETLKSVWVSGGGVLAPGLPAMLSEALGKEVALWDNLKKIEVAPAVDRALLEKHSSSLNIAFGLALRG